MLTMLLQGAVVIEDKTIQLFESDSDSDDETGSPYYSSF